MSKLPPPPLPPASQSLLQSLPHEIIELIVEHVSRRARLAAAAKKRPAATLTPAHLCHPDLHALAATCRALFLATMSTTWRHVTLDILFDKVDGDWVTGAWREHDLLDLLSRWPTPKKRDETDTVQSLVNYPYWNCTHAVTLHVRQHEEQLPFPTPWLGALRVMPYLTELSLVFTGYPTSNVTIDLCESEVIGEYLEHHLAAQLANLTVLRIDSSAESSWQVPSFFYLQLLSLPFPSLEKLALQVAQHGPLSHLEPGVDLSGALPDHDAEDAGFDTSNMKHLAQLITNATRLVTLELCFSRFITNEVIYAALFHPSIRTVELYSPRISDVAFPPIVGRSQVQTLKFTQDTMGMSHALLFCPLVKAQGESGLAIFEELITIQFHLGNVDPDIWESMLDCLARAPKLTTIDCRAISGAPVYPPPSLLQMITTHPTVRRVGLDALWLPALTVRTEWRALTVNYNPYQFAFARDLRTRFSTVAHLTLHGPLFPKATLVLAILWAGSESTQLERVSFTEFNYLQDAKYLPLPLQRVARHIVAWRAKRDRAQVFGGPVPPGPIIPARLQCVEDVMRVVVDLPTLEGMLGEDAVGEVANARCHFYRVR